MKKNSRKPLLLVLFICVSLFCNAQKALIPKDIKEYALNTGDTIIFQYSNQDKLIVPEYYGYNPDYANIAYYLEGYMSNTYHYVKQKKNVNGGFIYHGTYSNHWASPMALW